jgi:hypothetical protein
MPRTEPKENLSQFIKRTMGLSEAENKALAPKAPWRLAREAFKKRKKK